MFRGSQHILILIGKYLAALARRSIEQTPIYVMGLQHASNIGSFL